MNTFEKLAATIIVLLVITISLITIYDVLSSQSHTQAETNSFISEPVVDILVPSLFRETSTGGQNAPLNASAGQIDILAIDVYPNINLNLTMEFRYYFLANSSQITTLGNSSNSILASFVPRNLNIKAGKEGNTSVTLQFLRTASLGQYNAVFSALNSENASEVWGVIVQINLL